MHADNWRYAAIKNGVCIVAGPGPAIRIDGGRLVIRDGPLETPPLRLTRAEAHRRLRHVIVCGDAGGYVSFDALRWLRDTGVAFSQLDWNGTVIAASPTIPDQPALRRAQALDSSGAVPGADAAITRQILSVKLAGQARVARLLEPAAHAEARAIDRLAMAVARETDVARYSSPKRRARRVTGHSGTTCLSGSQDRTPTASDRTGAGNRDGAIRGIRSAHARRS